MVVGGTAQAHAHELAEEEAKTLIETRSGGHLNGHDELKPYENGTPQMGFSATPGGYPGRRPMIGLWLGQQPLRDTRPSPRRILPSRRGCDPLVDEIGKRFLLIEDLRAAGKKLNRLVD